MPFHLLLDAARMDAAMDTAKELNEEHRSLYRTKKGADEVLAVVAPFIFSYPYSQAFSDFVQSGWGDSWGIFIESDAVFEDLHKHFRRFLTVKTEDGEELYFRFYDPRVLRIFLPTCDRYQLEEFFGPVNRFIMEAEDPSRAAIFSFRKSQLVTEQVSKEQAAELLSYREPAAKKRSFWDAI